MKMIKWIFVFCILSLFISESYAYSTRFYQFVESLKREARHEGVSNKTINLAFGNVKLLYHKVKHAKVVHPTRLTFNDYMQQSVTSHRIAVGRLLNHRHKLLLKRISQRYHVPASIIISLWGLETNYGKIQGDYPEIDTLITMAYRSRRSHMFRHQLMAALKIIDRGEIDLKSMKGSWAGAMGQCQFMPETFLEFAVDYDHNGRKDIWQNDKDIFASMANYLHYLGYNDAHGFVVPVDVPRYYYPSWRYRYRHYSVNYWLHQGIKPKPGYHLPHSWARAALFFPNGDRKQAYLVYDDNFDVIYSWNHSTFYALSVGLLANRVN